MLIRSLLLLVFLSILVGCANRTPGPSSGDAKEQWSISAVTVTVSPGPPDAQGPTDILQERTRFLVPETQHVWLDRAERLYEAADRLDTVRGEAIANARQQSAIDSNTVSALSLSARLERLEQAAHHPAIQGPLIRRHIAKKGWSLQSREAVATLTLSEGPKQEYSVLPSATSTTLATLLRTAGAISGLIVDEDGEVIGATVRWFYPSLHRQAAWVHLKEASGEHILVTPPFQEPEYDFALRKAAVPVFDTDGETLVGWLLAKIYAGN